MKNIADMYVVLVFGVVILIGILSVLTAPLSIGRFFMGMKREMKEDRGHADLMATQMQHMFFSIMSSILSPMWKMPGQHAPNQSTMQSQTQTYSPENPNMVDYANANSAFYQQTYNPMQLSAQTPLLLAQRRKENSRSRRPGIIGVLSGALVLVTMCLFTVLMFK